MECDEMAMMGGENVLNRGIGWYRYMKCVCSRPALRDGMHGLIHPLAQLR